MQDHIFIKGARENNLKNIDVTIPRDKLVVLTGLSGSGKSSLAFDTIYAEGQRRYVESLSSYARMFLGQMDKPDVDYIEGLSPAISIDQKTTSKNPRSTVGTVTEIYDYLRLLWARVGTPHCPKCGKEIRQQTIDQIIDQIMALPEGTRIQVLAPVVRGRKGEHAKVLDDARRSGYVRVRADGNLYDLSEDIPLEKNKKHNIEIVVDRLIVRPDGAQRLTDSVETASHLSGGIVLVNLVREGQDLTFSQNYACDDCGISIEELTPRMFSFNNPFGACPTCTGLGMQLKADPALIIPDDRLSILDGAIVAPGWNSIRSDGISRMYFEALAKAYHFSLQTPVAQLPEEVRDVILYGTKGQKLELHYDQPRGRGTLYQPFEGVANNLERRYQETQSDASKREIEEFMTQCPCPACKGRRLRPEALAVTVGDLSIMEATELPVDRELEFFNALTLTPTQQLIAAQILKEIRSRLGFLQSVGLSYLTLSRSSGTLSGGESQRIRLATQIGSSLMGVLYILDEPTTGVDPVSRKEFWEMLRHLKDQGITILVSTPIMDEARQCDRIAFINEGEIQGIDVPERILQRFSHILCPPGLERTEVHAGNDFAIEVDQLTKCFGHFTAVDHISFRVNRGEIFGFLGANGAGKTTAMRMLCGLSKPTSGMARVAGFDVAAHPEEVKKNIGYMSQKFSLYEDLKVWENIRLFAGIYGMQDREIAEKTDALLDRLGFSGERDTLVKSLPLGWKQKLAFSVSIFHNPRIVFLDEPTGGVDPATRRQFWELIYQAADRGITVFVTTHYMDEAEYCNRVSIMVDGRIEALDTPRGLKAHFHADTMDDVFQQLARKAVRKAD